MSDIAINPVTRRVQFTGNTGTGPFAFTFNILADSDIAVYKGTVLLTLTTDYTVSINANGTGSITLTVALIASDVLTIIGGRELSRTTDFVTAGDLLASSLNEQLDSNVIMTQQLDEKLGRGLFVNPGDVFTDLELPLKDARKGTVLGFNATTGDPEPGPEIGDVDTIAAISADIKTLAEIQDGTVATDAITNVNTIRANVTTVSGISGNVTTVAGISSDVTTVAADGSDIGTVAGISSDVTTVAGISGNVTTVAGNTTNINSVAGNSTNINTVAGNTTEINAVAGKATEIGRLGTVDAVSDLNTLGTADVVSDMNTLGTSGNVNNMSTLAGISANITTVAGISANVTTVAGDTANISAVAGNSTNINTVAGQTTNLQNVTDNLADIQNASANAASALSSKNAAATSETNAANSAAAAAASYDQFDDRYLGSKTSDPTVDNDGNPLVSGALYFNSTANEMRVYDGANWIPASSAGSASLILYEYTATSGQTTFSGADDNSATLSYSVGNIQVVLNGVVLDPSDFTATSGTSIVLASGAATGDLLNIYAFKSFTVADTVSASAGGTFAGDVNFTANFTSRGIDDNATSTAMTLDSSGNLLVGTTSDYAENVQAAFYGASNGGISLASGTAGLSRLMFADGVAGTAGAYVGSIIYSHADDSLRFNVNGGAERMRIDSSGNVGIGVVPEAWSSLYGTKALQVGSQTSLSEISGDLHLSSNAYYDTTDARWEYINADYATKYTQTDGIHQWLTAASGSADAAITWSEAMRIDSSGSVGIGCTPASTVSLDVQNLSASSNNVFLRIKNATDQEDAGLIIEGQNGGAREYKIGVNSIANSPDLTFSGPTGYRYYVGGSERMRLTNGGYLALGNTLLPTNGTAGVTLAPEGNVHCGVATTANTNVMRFDNPNGRVGSISTTNSSTSYNTSSDYRLKTDAQPMTGASARVQALNPVNFEWIADGTRVDGFLAHEAQEIVPEAVTGTKDAVDADGNPEYQGIDQSKLVPLLTAALQEALTEISDLKARVTALEAV